MKEKTNKEKLEQLQQIVLIEEREKILCEKRRENSKEWTSKDEKEFRDIQHKLCKYKHEEYKEWLKNRKAGIFTGFALAVSIFSLIAAILAILTG